MDKRIALRFTTDCNGRHLAFRGHGRRWLAVSMDTAIEWLTTDRAYVAVIVP